MKKFFVILVVSLFSFFTNCEKTEMIDETVDSQPKEIREFLNSPDFAKYQGKISEIGRYGVGEVFLYEDGSIQMALPLYNKFDSLVAKLQVIKMYKGILPDDADEYFINVIYLSKFDESSLSGIITMSGMNFDNFVHTEYYVLDNVIQEDIHYPVPAKFQDISAKNFLPEFFSCYRRTMGYYHNNDTWNWVCGVTGAVCAWSASGLCLIQESGLQHLYLKGENCDKEINFNLK